MKLKRWNAVIVGVVALNLMSAKSGYAASCESLKSLKIENTQISSATEITTPPAQLGPMASKITVPFCRVVFTLIPTSDSNIRAEMWLPESDHWNGKFLETGNGGPGGRIQYPGLIGGVDHGYATTNTDMGSGPLKRAYGLPSYEFGVGHPEKINDWGWRAIHVATLASKQLAKSYYGKSAQEAYFDSCSTGGRAALTEAQRFPDDYNGIVSGDPAFDTARMHAEAIWAYEVTHDNPSDYFPASKLPLLYNAQIKACDALDGVVDGVISDPTKCKFDPGVLTCKQGDGPDCFTPAQVTAIRKLFKGPTNPRTGELLMPGPEPGALMSSGVGVKRVLRYPANNGPIPPKGMLGALVWAKDLKGPGFDFDHDMALADKDLDFLNATDPDLRAFKTHGGKLLIYSGWADPAITPKAVINYYTSVEKVMGGAEATRSFARLFMVPGMGHCMNGPGATKFNPLVTLDKWVETGTPPSSILATGTRAGHSFTRPICPFPEVTTWKGSGSTDEASNFSCIAKKTSEK